MAKEDKTVVKSLAVRTLYGPVGHQPSLSSTVIVPQCREILPFHPSWTGRSRLGQHGGSTTRAGTRYILQCYQGRLQCYTLRCALYATWRMADLERTFSVVFGDSDLLERCTLWAMACCGSCPPCMDLPRPAPRVQRQMTSSSTYATTPKTPFSARHATRPFLYPPTMPVPCENSRGRTGAFLRLITLVDTAPRSIDPIYRE